ncbi:MAG: hypothetical protein J6S14_12050 [Clostridia bacterium]|nr:hypothetical protein [Clostridia bacterium]
MVSLNYSSGTGYCVYAGLSTDTKPTEGINTGSKFREVDTGKEYFFDSESSEWIIPGGGGGGDAKSAKVGTGKVGSMIIE